MKIFILLSFALVLFAFDNITAAKIFDKIFLAMYDKQSINVYTKDKTYKEVVQIASSLHLIDECQSADVIIITSLKDIQEKCRDKLHFSTSYFVFQEFQNAVGVFYWDRGRISIKFSKARLDKYSIELPRTFDKYLTKEKL